MPKNRDERITLRDVIERFITDVIALRNSAETEELWLRSVCDRPIASRRLAEITNSDLCHYRDQRRRQVKRNTFVRELGLVRTVAATAINNWGTAVDNPLSRFRVKRERDQRLRHLSNKELQCLISSEFGSAYLKPLMILALETAMRWGELLSLRLSRIDMEKGFVEL